MCRTSSVIAPPSGCGVEASAGLEAQACSSESGRKAHELIPGSKLHDLGLKDEDVDLIPYPDWSPYEAEISTVLTEFMHQH